MVIGKCPGNDEKPARAGAGGGHRRDVQLCRSRQGRQNLLEVLTISIWLQTHICFTYIQDGLTQSTNAGHNIKCKAPVLSIRSNKLLRPIQQDSVFSEFQTMVNPGSSSNGSQQPMQPTKVIVTNTPSKQQ